MNVLMSMSTTPCQVEKILDKESLVATISAVSVSYPASTNFLMSSSLNFAARHLSSIPRLGKGPSLVILVHQGKEKKRVARKTMKKWKIKIKP